ncbi:MAG TPA: YhcH/YjgK/YiaL family protein [Prevotella sp.]
MILAHLNDSKRYECVHPLFKVLFEYLRTHDLSNAEKGRITLAGDDLYINVSDVELKDKDQQKLEVHQQYIDVQLPLLQPEVMGWRHLASLPAPDNEFNVEQDFALYSAPAAEYFTVQPGQFAIFFPEDAHAPIIGSGFQHKLIAKVRI